MGAREGAEVLDPVSGGRLGLEAAEDAVEQRGDELVLGREVVVEGHRHGVEPGGDRPHRQPVEALGRDRFRGVEDRLLAPGPPRSPGPRSTVVVRLVRDRASGRALTGLIAGGAVGAAQAALLGAGRWAAVTAAAWTLGWMPTVAIGVDVEQGFFVFGSSGAASTSAMA